MLKRYFEKQKYKFFRSMQKRLIPTQPVHDTNQFNLMCLLAARALATDKDFRRIPMIKPWDEQQAEQQLKQARIGFYGNMANNHYLIVKALRKLGYHADLVLEDKRLDAFPLSRPFWEDVSTSSRSYDEALVHEAVWEQPDYVIRMCYDEEMNRRYAGRLSAIPEVQALYLKDFGVRLPADKALLLGQMMGYWSYLLTMKKYDFVQFCNAPIMLAPFCPRPYLIIPAGGELQLVAFEETIKGLLFRSGFRQAVTVLNGDSGNPEYFARLGEIDQTTIRWMIDLRDYPAGPDAALKRSWQEQIGGEHFIVMPCRQVWAEKGNDIFLRAFAKVAEKFPQWRVILLEWGTDIERTKALIQELNLSTIHWMPLLSKALLHRYQATADLVVDHCLDFGVGAAPIEAMAAGSPVLIRLRGQHKDFIWGGEHPPFLTFDGAEELPGLLAQWMMDPASLAERGKLSRNWVQNHLSVETGFEFHKQGYLKALRVSMLMDQKS